MGAFLSQGHGKGSCRHVTPDRESHGDALAVDTHGLNNGVGVGVRNLVGYIGAHVAPVPAVLVSFFPSLSDQLQAVLEQTGGIRIHPLVGFTANAEVAVLGSRAGDRTDNRVACGVQVGAANDGGRSSRAQG